jgi:Ca2+-binding EF-hand superfamily protein
MGCGGSTPIHATGQSRRYFEKLHIEDTTVQILWNTFKKIDKGKDEQIEMKEFLDFYGFEDTPFRRMVFSRMDYGCSGKINFEEYAISVWDFLTCDLNHFVFHLYDIDDSKFLSHYELEQISMGVYGIPFGHNRKSDKVVERADGDGDGKVSFDEFCEFTKRNQNIAYPGHILQKELMDRNGGESLWRELKRRRHLSTKDKSLHQILNNQASHAPPATKGNR